MARSQTTLSTDLPGHSLDQDNQLPGPRGPQTQNEELPASLRALRFGLLSQSALAALGAHGSGVPQALWRRALIEPVQEILSRPGKGFRGRLTEMAYRLAGGKGTPPEALAAMLEIVHAGSMIIDDIEDGSRERRGAPTVHRLCGLPLALNAGNWMYFAPFEILEDLALPPLAELRLRRRMGRVMLDCHYGQALDLAARPSSVTQARLPDVVATLSVLKTGRLLSLAAEAGALCAGASESQLQDIAEFGEALGVGLQMLDDLGNLSGHAPADKRYEDLRNGRVTWPWAWAAQQLDEDRFAGLVARAEQLSAEDQLATGARPSIARWEGLATTMRTAVGAHGRLQTHWHLREALCRLRDRGGPNPLIDVLEREIARLEVSYG